jgi:hypothetical protein
MATYQIYARASIGRVVSSQEITCHSDAKALQQARKHVIQGTHTELWCGERYVGRVTAKNTRSAVTARPRSQEGQGSPAA